MMARPPDHLVATAMPPAAPHSEEPAGAPAVLDVAQDEQDADHRPDGDEDVQGGDARLRDA